MQDDNPLHNYFQGKDILVLGTIQNPLFCITHIGKYIDDKNIYKNITNNDNFNINPNDIVIGKMLCADGTHRDAKFFTEGGLYDYLLASKRDKAKEFHKFMTQVMIKTRDLYVEKDKINITKIQELQFDKDKLAKDNAELRAILFKTRRSNFSSFSLSKFAKHHVKKLINLKHKIANHINFDIIKNKSTICNITPAVIMSMYLRDDMCVYCGDKLLLTYKPRCYHQLSIDRIDNSAGHTRDNIQLSCYSCNIFKADRKNITDEQLIEKKISRKCPSGCH